MSLRQKACAELRRRDVGGFFTPGTLAHKANYPSASRLGITTLAPGTWEALVPSGWGLSPSGLERVDDPTAIDARRKRIGGDNLAPASRKKGPAVQAGQTIQRFISTSTPGRRSLLISTSGSRTRRRSSIVTSGSRTPFPTVTSGVRVQLSPHSGPTQFRSHTSAAFAGSERMAELVNAAATAKTRAVRISNLHDFFDAHQREMSTAVPGFPRHFLSPSLGV